MTNRQKTAMEIKRRLMETGKRMIAEQGFSNVSIDDIVKACGVARGTFYTYFKNKEDKDGKKLDYDLLVYVKRFV